MDEYDVEPFLPGENTRGKGRPLSNALKRVIKAPFKLTKGLVEEIAAPVVMTPYQLATDAFVRNKLKKPIEYKHDVEFAGLSVPVSHKLDASKSSVDRGFSFNRGGFTTDYNLVLDHEIRLGEAKPLSDPSKASEFANNSKVPISKPLGTGLHPRNR